MPLPLTRFGSSLLLSTLSYRDGEIGLYMVAVNQAQTAMTLNFATAKTHDFALLDEKQIEYWRWSTGQEFAQVFTSITIAPGRFYVFDLDLTALPLPKGVRPDKVVVRGELLSLNLSCTAEQILPLG